VKAVKDNKILIVGCFEDFLLNVNPEVIYKFNKNKCYFAQRNEDDNLIRVYFQFTKGSYIFSLEEFNSHFVIKDRDFLLREPDKNYKYLISRDQINNVTKDILFLSLNWNTLDNYDKYLFNYNNEKEGLNLYHDFNWKDYEFSRMEKEKKDNKQYLSIFEFAVQELGLNN
jgi:hypothetical protein